jgi:hypothetical protein
MYSLPVKCEISTPRGLQRDDINTEHLQIYPHFPIPSDELTLEPPPPLYADDDEDPGDNSYNNGDDDDDFLAFDNYELEAATKGPTSSATPKAALSPVRPLTCTRLWIPSANKN